MIYFTSDEHYFHKRCIEYSNRPFSSLEEMHEILIQNNNKVVKKNDTVYHVGDFTFEKNLEKIQTQIIDKLNGNHIFVLGGHDYWHKSLCRHLNQRIVFNSIELIKFDKKYIVACHYPITFWPKSHYGSWHVFGHCHGAFKHHGKAWDVGVDNNNYTPLSFDELSAIMSTLPQNTNYVHRSKRKYIV